MILLRGGDAAARGAARQAHAEGAVHGRRVGVPGRRRRRVDRTAPAPTARRGPRALRAAAARELREEAGIELADRAELVEFSRWITPAQVRIRFDTHFFLARCRPGTGAARRRRGVRGPRLVHAPGCARRPRRRRHRARLPHDQAPRAARPLRAPSRRCSHTRAGARCSRSSRGSCSRARSPACCCPAIPATDASAQPAGRRPRGSPR